MVIINVGLNVWCMILVGNYDFSKFWLIYVGFTKSVFNLSAVCV